MSTLSTSFLFVLEDISLLELSLNSLVVMSEKNSMKRIPEEGDNLSREKQSRSATLFGSRITIVPWRARNKLEDPLSNSSELKKPSNCVYAFSQRALYFFIIYQGRNEIYLELKVGPIFQWNCPGAAIPSRPLKPGFLETFSNAFLTSPFASSISLCS